jgi:putative nucleotidyltransferase with HDIG domain
MMRMDQIGRGIKTFPGMPGAAIKLLALVDDPGTTVPQIESILGQDPGLTANLLKLANSAYFGFPSKVGSVRQAIVLLGLKRLTRMVIAACVSALLDGSVPGYDLPAGELWRHSLAVSVAAKGLVRELKIEASEEIFTAGLLHDVGKIVLGQLVQDDYAKIEQALAQGLAFEAAEAVVLGKDHAEVGAEVLAKWSLPPNIVHTVRWHHAPEKSERIDTMLDIVHVANMLCLMIGIGVGREGLQHEPSLAVTRRLGLEPVHLEKVASETLQWANELSQTLNVAPTERRR